MNSIPASIPTVARTATPSSSHQRKPRDGSAGSLAMLFLISIALGAIALAACLLLSTPASAEEGTITIHSLANSEAQYDAYEIFKAEVEDGTREGAPDGNATHIKWASEQTQTAVTGILNANGYQDWLTENGHDADSASNPQYAAEFIGERITASEDDTDAGSEPAAKMGTSFALTLAQALVSAGIEPLTATADETFTGEEGLWLFVTHTESIGADESGSSALWIPIGSSTTSIDEKARTSTLQKQVQSNVDGTWGEWTDAHFGENINYKIAFTVPDNIGSYAHYHWKIDDALPTGLELVSGDVSTVKVSVGENDLTGDASLNYSENILSVEFADLLDCLTICKGDVLTIEYQAHFVTGAVLGSQGNTNVATCTHTADPVSEGDVTDTPVQATVYTWQLNLTKYDKSTQETLAGAKFTICKADADGTQIENAYLQADGSVGKIAYEFESNEEGLISVSYIASGNYLIHETGAPAGYELQDSDITLTISLETNEQTGRPESFTAHLTGGESADDDSEIATKVESADAASGIVHVVTSDDKRSMLPLTGLDGRTALYLAAVLCAAASIALYARKKRDASHAKRKSIRGWREKCQGSAQRHG